MRIFPVVVAVLLLSVAPSSFPQGKRPRESQAPSAPADQSTYTLTVTTRLIDVSAVVRHNGIPVRTLTKDDFKVYEDGRKKTLRYFDFDEDLPLTIGLLVDTSRSEFPYAQEEAAASRKFLHDMLTRPQDRAFTARFDWRTQIMQGLTANVSALDKNMDHLTNPAEITRRGGTKLWDAIGAATAQIMTQQRGRRALIVMTDGEDRGSRITLDQAIAAAQLNDVAVYSILYTRKTAGMLTKMDPTLRRATDTTSGGKRDRQTNPTGPTEMETLADSTGGRSFLAGEHSTGDSQHAIDSIFAAIEEDLRSEYRFGFTPVKAPAYSHHTVRVAVRGKGLEVQARNMYITPPADAAH